MAAMEREVELERRAVDASTALARIQIWLGYCARLLLLPIPRDQDGVPYVIKNYCQPNYNLKIPPYCTMRPSLMHPYTEIFPFLEGVMS
ncbi:unnamed protein product [Rhodiola kirilowii]